jgi:hypothetical protein
MLTVDVCAHAVVLRVHDCDCYLHCYLLLPVPALRLTVRRGDGPMGQAWIRHGHDAGHPPSPERQAPETTSQQGQRSKMATAATHTHTRTPSAGETASAPVGRNSAATASQAHAACPQRTVASHAPYLSLSPLLVPLPLVVFPCCLCWGGSSVPLCGELRPRVSKGSRAGLLGLVPGIRPLTHARTVLAHNTKCTDRRALQRRAQRLRLPDPALLPPQAANGRTHVARAARPTRTDRLSARGRPQKTARLFGRA